MEAIVHFINSPLTSALLRTHPNEYDPSAPPWARSGYHIPRDSLPTWDSLLSDPAPPFRDFVHQARSVAIDRIPVPLPKGEYEFNKQGMSPKKEHEVNRMIALISGLASRQGVKHAVDIGSGQGYLTRALNDELGLDVLALDSNPNQTTGAEQWTRKQSKGRAPAITHQTLHVTPESLRHAINDWVSPFISDANDVDASASAPVPILFVALHACGSLTVDILRSFFALKASAQPMAWRPTTLVLVGCCYNLLDPRDFPLSNTLISQPNLPKLDSAAFQLAAQIPALWTSSESARKQADLAIRKVVYRALFQYIYVKDPGSTTRRLGKLNNRHYATWDSFVEEAKRRMQIDDIMIQVDDNQRKGMGRELEVLHALRCLIGPVVESLILLDRIEWIKENIGKASNARLISLFDQATGSGRNMAIVIEPGYEGLG